MQRVPSDLSAQVPAEKKPPRRSSFATAKPALAGSIAGAAFLFILLLLRASADAPLQVLVPNDGVKDVGDPVVGTAAFTMPVLVHPGTTQPYTGQGPIGIRLVVEAKGDTSPWILHGWANETTPPPYPVRACADPNLFFDRYDWAFEADRDSTTGDRAVFATIPTTVPGRLAPGGDQCHARVQATGVFHVTVCVEGAPTDEEDAKAVDQPRGPYKDRDGIWRIDVWDRCVDRLVTVPS